MTTLTNTTRRSAAARRFSLSTMLGLARQRRDLSQLDAHLLRDIGLTPDEARAEALRPAWDVPRHWRA